MRVAVAQTRPVAGDVTRNLVGHLRCVEVAAQLGAGRLAFPELSLTGYEPALAAELAIDADDARLAPLRAAAERYAMTIIVGAPTSCTGGVCISSLVIEPSGERGVYSKQFLHADEEPFFVAGPRRQHLLGERGEIALAICYELSVAEHAAAAAACGASVYLASVAKTAAGVQRAHARMAEIARTHGMAALLANCVGVADGVACAGGSAAWNARGDLLAQLDADTEGVLVLDVEADQVDARMF